MRDQIMYLSLLLLVYLEELVLQRSKGANLMSEVIGDNNDFPAIGVLWSEHGEPPCNHSNLGRDGGHLQSNH